MRPELRPRGHRPAGERQRDKLRVCQAFEWTERGANQVVRKAWRESPQLAGRKHLHGEIELLLAGDGRPEDLHLLVSFCNQQAAVLVDAKRTAKVLLHLTPGPRGSGLQRQHLSQNSVGEPGFERAYLDMQAAGFGARATSI